MQRLFQAFFHPLQLPVNSFNFSFQKWRQRDHNEVLLLLNEDKSVFEYFVIHY